MVKVVKELKVELIKIDNDNYYRLLFDDNMNIFVHPSIVRKNGKDQNIVNFFDTNLIIKDTSLKHYFIIKPDDIKSIKVLTSDKPLEIDIYVAYDYNGEGYYFEFKLKSKYYYFIYGGYKGFTFRYNGVLYTVKKNQIKEIKEYTPPEDFKIIIARSSHSL